MAFEYRDMDFTRIAGVLDGRNVISLGPTTYIDSIAETIPWVRNGRFVEIDIVLNIHFSFGIGEPNKLDIQNFVTHEAGHFAGLSDLYGDLDKEKTMFGTGGPGEVKKRTLEPDDIAGIQYIYPGTRTPDRPCIPDAALASESIIPNNVLSPGQSFTKVWRIKNIGSCPWNGPVRLNFQSGDQMGAPQYQLAPPTGQNEIAEFRIPMVAPMPPNTYTGYWQMCWGFCVANSVFFGQPVIVQITIPDSNPTAPPNSGILPDIEIRTVEYPSVVSPGQRFRPRITVKVNQGQLLQSRGDLLRTTDNNLYGAWPHVSVVGTVNAGQTHTFEFYENNPITAPSIEGTYHSKWRVWRNNDWAGSEIDIRFDVRGTAATRPNAPTLVSPSNWSVSQDGSTPTLCASAPSGLQYYFQIYESTQIPDSHVGNPSSADGWVNSNCWMPPTLGIYGYQWHVKVRDPATGLESDWSQTWHFEIASQEVIMHGIFFSPSSPSAGVEVDGEPAVVRVWACVV